MTVLTLDVIKFSESTLIYTIFPKSSFFVEALHWTSDNLFSVHLHSSLKLWKPPFSKGNTLSDQDPRFFFLLSPGKALLITYVFQK